MGSGSASSSSASSPTKPARPARPTRLPSSSSLQPRRLSPLPPPSRPRTPVPLSRSPSVAPPLPPPPLHLTIRFSAALPDLHLEILTPHQTTVAALKHLIRSRLTAQAVEADKATDTSNSSNDAAAAAALARGRLRFIHAGKILPDGAALSAVLKPLPPPPPPPPPPPSTSYFPAPGSAASDPRGKGKAVEGRDAAAGQRVYVNCSIGDALSDAELAAEAALAAEKPTDGGQGVGGTGAGAARAGLGGIGGGGGVSSGFGTLADGARRTAAGTRPPRGFDRLLQTGFTPAEVSQLRLQFRSIQAARHTPDTMPSPDTLRTLEDAWIDNNSSSGGGGGGSGGGGGGGGGGAGSFFGTGGRRADGDDGGAADLEDGAGLVGVLDILIKGMVIGFMFPLGSAGWLVREESMWSRRWRIFITLGFVVSFIIGTIRALSGDK